MTRRSNRHKRTVYKLERLITEPLTPPQTSEEVEKNLKHMLCNSIERGVLCPHGDRCWYSHTEAERQQHIVKKPCKYLLPDGSCTRLNCRYDHSMPLPQRINKPCFYLQNNSVCPYGSLCRFLHEWPVVDSMDERTDDDSDIEVQQFTNYYQRFHEDFYASSLAPKPVSKVYTVRVVVKDSTDLDTVLQHIRSLTPCISDVQLTSSDTPQPFFTVDMQDQSDTCSPTSFVTVSEMNSPSLDYSRYYLQSPQSPTLFALDS